MSAYGWQDPPPRGGGVQLAMPGFTPVVKWLLVANGGVFVLLLLLSGQPGIQRSIVEVLALDPPAWASFLLPVWQLVTYGFVHLEPFHLLGNMLFLYFLGTMLEGIVGSRRLLVFYLVCVVFAGLAQLVIGMALGQSAPILGASGGALGVTWAMATLRPGTRIIFLFVPMTLRTLALIYLALDVINVLQQVLGGPGSNVASFAHLGGAALGWLAVRRGWIWRDPVASFEEARARRASDAQARDQARLDDLLERIHRDGIGSLSTRERAFLKRMSKHR